MVIPSKSTAVISGPLRWLAEGVVVIAVLVACWAIGTVLIEASLARADDPLPYVPGATGQCVMRLQPAEIDTYSVTFVGRTITTANKGTATAALAGNPKQADASPTSIITAHSSNEASGNSAISITLKPDQGCAATGCRAGNDYVITLQPTDSASNKPIANCYLQVRKPILVPQ